MNLPNNQNSNQYLLDTHIFIWANKEPEKLSENIQKILSNPNNQLYFSMVALWEMQIKMQLGKLKVSTGLKQLIADIKQDNLYQILPIKDTHIINLEKLPTIHRDPFDRLMISQAMIENMTFLSVDSFVQQYPIQVIS
ncbi:MAG: type II toxin-antitoxin system VapC family toxin [Moraxellaceae bacterium]|nr:type II toxin-antitoxin system VapC family toxin [Moraxellaceae bacterium]